MFQTTSRIKAAALIKLLTFCLCFHVAVTKARCESSPKYEMRGAWIATVYGIDWPSVKGSDEPTAMQQMAQLNEMLVGLEQAGINAVFFQVRPMADALYRSELAPWSAHISSRRGLAPAFDPLSFCVERCHELGLECHAWLNPFRVGDKTAAAREDEKYKHLWMTHTVGRQRMTILNPALDQTRLMLCDVCRELAENYDIDGIVFDDYFYHPEFLPEDESATDHKDYIASGTDLSFADWRRQNINQTIAEVYAALQQIKDGAVRFGVSPQGIAGGGGVHSDAGVSSLQSFGVTTADSQYSKIYADPVQWLRDGTVDYISPQIYWPTTQKRHPYGGLAAWWYATADMFGRHCFPSHTVAQFKDDNSENAWDERIAQIEINRQEAATSAAPGSVFYSASWIVGPRKSGFGNYLRDNIFVAKALMPPMHWKKADETRTVSNLVYNDGILSWDQLPSARYVIYIIPDDIPHDRCLSDSGKGLSADYIAAVTYSNSYRLEPETLENFLVAVTVYDRFGNEGSPIFYERH